LKTLHVKLEHTQEHMFCILPADTSTHWPTTRLGWRHQSNWFTVVWNGGSPYLLVPWLQMLWNV